MTEPTASDNAASAADNPNPPAGVGDKYSFGSRVEKFRGIFREDGGAGFRLA
jgi:hypothetical protein